MLTILALDTAVSACSVALWRDGGTRAHRLEAMTRGHAEALLPMVESVMAEARFAYPGLDMIAATVGPGTFTGLRVGLATARGLALACAHPLLGVGTLEALAQGTGEVERRGRHVLAVMDARRGELYAELFASDLASLAGPRRILPEALGALAAGVSLLLVGDGAPAATKALPGADLLRSQAPPYPDAAGVAAIAARAPERARSGQEVRPLYLRGPGASPPGAGPPGAGAGRRPGG